jgi:hypothetical protein
MVTEIVKLRAGMGVPPKETHWSYNERKQKLNMHCPNNSNVGDLKTTVSHMLEMN